MQHACLPSLHYSLIKLRLFAVVSKQVPMECSRLFLIGVSSPLPYILFPSRFSKHHRHHHHHAIGPHLFETNWFE